MLYSKYPNEHFFNYTCTHIHIYTLHMSNRLMLCLIWDTHCKCIPLDAKLGTPIVTTQHDHLAC